MASSSAPPKDPQPAASTDTGKQPEDTTKKSATALEEDDEFEDFPVEGVCVVRVQDLLRAFPPPSLPNVNPLMADHLSLGKQNRLARRGNRGR